MRRNEIMRGIFAAGIIGLLLTGVASAKEEHLAMVYYIDVKDGHEEAFYKATQAHSKYRSEEGDPWTWHVYQSVVGENLGQYVIRSGGHGWECFDAYKEPSMKLTEHWNKTVAPHVEKITNRISKDDEDMQYGIDELDAFKLFQVVKYDLKPGHYGKFTEAIQAYHDTIVEHEFQTKYKFLWTVSGGDEYDVFLVLPYENYADMEGPEEKLWAFIQRIHGEKEAEKLGEKFSGSVRKSTDCILRYHPELSVLPE